MYFVNKGLARVYYYRNEIEVTDYFAMDQQFIGGVESLFTRQPSKKAIQLIENSDIYFFSSADFDACCSHYHAIETAARKLAPLLFWNASRGLKVSVFIQPKNATNSWRKDIPASATAAP